jgi:serine/threonine-protein kinase
VNDFTGRPDEEDVFTLAIDRDRWRLGAYYITDWILRRRQGEFAVSEIMGAQEGTAGEWLKRASPAKLQELIDHFVQAGILRVARDPGTGTIIGDAPQERTYEIDPGVRRELSSLARNSVRERGDLSPAPPPVPGVEEPGASTSPWADSDELGTVRHGRYQLEEVIGRGGMGTVYRARDQALERDVAVKMLEAAHLREDETARARFRREADLAASLSHPSIVSTYEAFEEPDGRLAIVMELVKGASLRELVPLAPDTAVRLAATLLDALAYMGQRGMVRVDLKPENIIVKADGRPVIVDLGLVKTIAADDKFDTLIPEGPPITIGTPSYMSPEQVRQDPLDIRSDLHALGLVLFEMITGEQAFTADSAMAVLFKVLNDEVDTSKLPVSGELRHVIARATAKNPADRFQSPSEMRAALLATPEGSR